MARISTAPIKGARDFLPRDLAPRNRVFQLMRDTFERYGYEPLETPAIEHSSALEGKYGEEGERLLFRILKNGRDLESAASELDGDPGAKRTAGSLAWAGLANTYYWIEPNRKLAGVFLSQVLPFADARVLGVFDHFERAIYASRR